MPLLSHQGMEDAVLDVHPGDEGGIRLGIIDIFLQGGKCDEARKTAVMVMGTELS